MTNILTLSPRCASALISLLQKVLLILKQHVGRDKKRKCLCGFSRGCSGICCAIYDIRFGKNTWPTFSFFVFGLYHEAKNTVN